MSLQATRGAHGGRGPGAAVRGPQLALPSGHFSHVEAVSGKAEPGFGAGECSLPGPGSRGSRGAPEGPRGSLGPGVHCVRGGQVPQLCRLQELQVTCWDSHFSHQSDTTAPRRCHQMPGTLAIRALSAVLESGGNPDGLQG